MKLEGVYDGRVYGSSGRTVLTETANGDRRIEGRVSPAPSLPTRVLIDRPGRTLVESLVGRYLTTNVWRVSDSCTLATVGRRLYTSHDGCESWQPRLELPESSGLRGLLPGSVCITEEAIYLGEYPLAEDATPRVLRSTDKGRTWDVVVELPDVRHVHAVQTDPYSGDIWVTTGDTDPECRIGRLRDGQLETVVSGSQRFRAVELAFTPESVLWGVDCAYVGANELVRLDRGVIESADPDPQVVGHVGSSVYQAAAFEVDGTAWVAFATAGEVGADRTAPAGASTAGAGQPVVVAASAATGFREWYELVRFERRRCVAALPGAGRLLPRASAYVFLAVHPDRGLLVNPYNATPEDGSIVEIPRKTVRRLSTDSGVKPTREPGGGRLTPDSPDL